MRALLLYRSLLRELGGLSKDARPKLVQNVRELFDLHRAERNPARLQQHFEAADNALKIVKVAGALLRG